MATASGEFKLYRARDRRFVWRWLDGSTLSFDKDGRLTATERNNGQKLLLAYQSLQFEYNDQRLTGVTLPDSRQLKFNYDPQRVLTSVERETDVIWQYQYADEHLSGVTAVINANGEQIATVRYNANGRAISSTPGSDQTTQESVQLQFTQPSSVRHTGNTTLTGGDGKSATYTWRYNPNTQQRELLSASGEQCSSCPVTGVKRTYDKHGRQTSTIDTAASKPSTLRRWRYDKQGRLKAMYINSQNGIDKGFWRHYKYASNRPDANLVLIDSPSRAPGKRHRIELRYNQLNQLITRRETGYEPDITSLTVRANNWQIGKWRKLQRIWRYQYVQRGTAQGLIESIDGPLPGDTDKTVHHYDDSGNRIQTIRPGNQVTRFTYDQYGLLASTTTPLATPQSTGATHKALLCAPSISRYARTTNAIEITT